MRRPLHEQVRRAVQDRIVSGEYALGSLLPLERELCAEFDVSPITVRRALKDLSDEGMIRGERAVGTRVVSTTKRRTIALVFIGFDDADWLQRAELFGSLVGAVAKVAWSRRADLTTVSVPWQEHSRDQLRTVLKRGDIDGLLIRIAGDAEEWLVRMLERSGKPYVVLKRHMPGRRMNFVTVDDVDAARRATTHLLELGHRRIGLIIGPLDILPRRDQLSGYKRGLDDHGVGFAAELLMHGHDNHLAGYEDGFNGMSTLLRLDDPPTAVVIGARLMATGAMDALVRAGLDVPEDVALVCFADRYWAETFRPKLTTLTTQYEAIGSVGAEALLDMIDDPELTVERHLHLPLEVRGSSQPHLPGVAAVEALENPSQF